MVFCWVECVASLFHASFVVALMAMVIFLGNVPALVLLRFVKNPEFHFTISCEQIGALALCLLWHGWFPLFSDSNGDSPWADTVAQGTGISYNRLLGFAPHVMILSGACLMTLGSVLTVGVGEHLDVWTDGSFVLDEISGASSSGSGFFAHLSGQD